MKPTHAQLVNLLREIVWASPQVLPELLERARQLLCLRESVATTKRPNDAQTGAERRLREMAEGLVNGAPECWNGDDARAQVGWAQDMTVAADVIRDALALLREWSRGDYGFPEEDSRRFTEDARALLARCEAVD